MNDSHVVFEFGPYRLEGRERRLSRGAEPVVLPPKVFDTLLLLVENAGHVLTKSELMASLWAGTAVEEGNLTKNIWQIRRALGESEGENRYIETVPKAGYRFVATVRTVSGPRPTIVPPEASPSAAAASDVASAAALAPSPALRQARRRWATGGAALAAVALVFGLAWIIRTRAPARPAARRTAAAIPSRRSVAVLRLQNLSGRPDTAWLSTAVAEMISADIGAGETLRLVPAETVARVAGSPSAAGALSPETLRKLRAALGADLVVSGSYVAIPAASGDAVRFDLILQDTEKADVVATVTETGSQSDLFGLVSSAGSRLRFGLGLAATPSSGPETLAAAIPKDPEAARLYAEGLAKLRAGDALGARPLLEASIRSAAGFGPAHEALSLAWTALGYDANAREEAENAFRLAPAFPPGLRMSAEARLAETEKNWERAEGLDAAIFRAHPDDPETGLRLASTQVAGGRAKEALATLSALGTLRAPVRDDPRIDLARADAFAALSKWPDEIAACRAATAKAQRNGSTRLVAEARLREAAALVSLGDKAKGKDAYEEAASLFRREGDSNGEAEAWIGIANEIVDEGRTLEGEHLFRQAQATFERTGNRRGEAHALSDLANLAWVGGDVDSALLSVRKVLAINREINNPKGVVWGLVATGNLLADGGRFDEALALQREGVSICRKIGDEEYLAYSVASVADTFLAQGRLEDARRMYEEALAMSKKLGDAQAQATHENDLGNVLAEQGNFVEADRHYASALGSRRSLGVADEVAETQMLIAALRNAEGRYSEAAVLAAEAARFFDSVHETGNGAIALADQARAETGLGKLAEARGLCARARELLKDNRQNGANLPVLREAIRIETAASNLEAARGLLGDFDGRARKSRRPFYVLEARLAAAEIDIRGGKTEEGLRRLRAVAEDAKSQGFHLIAAEARNVLRGSPTSTRVN